MSLFKKPKKRMQMRILNVDDDDDENNSNKIIEAPPPPPTVKSETKKKDSKENKQKQVLLSFGDEVEDDADSFQVRKSSQSKRLQKQRDRERKEKNAPPPLPPPAPIISDMMNLKEESSKKKQSNSLEGVILSGRAAFTAGKDDVSGSEDESEEESNQNGQGSHVFKHMDKSVRALLDSGAIPDAAVIYAARKKRQQAREIGDYIPIENNNSDNSSRVVTSSRREGRLVREDGAGDGSDEDADRIEVCGVAPDQKKERMKIAAQDQNTNGSDIDSDNDEWETQQIRKAVTHNQIIAAQQETYYGNQTYSIPIMQKQEIELNPFAVAPSMPMLSDHLRPLVGPTETLTIDQLISALHARKDQLEETKAKKEQELDEMNNELERLTILRKTCTERAPLYSVKYAFYQKLRGYLTELIECLDEKMPMITALEARSMTLMKRKAAFLCERRRADIRDQANEALTKPSGGKRDVKDEERNRRVAEREGRRLRRRHMRDQDESSSLPHRDGDSSDDEIPQVELTAYESIREKIVSDSEEVFADTLDEYASIASVLQKMESWRSEDRSAYIEAYVTTCLPKLIAPYLRHRLLLWNPIIDDSAPDWEGMQWYRGLMLYGLSEETESETEATLLNDPDICLIPNVIHSILLPKITELVEGTWEPISGSQSRRLSQLVKRAANLPGITANSVPLQSLVSAVVKKVNLALQHDVFIPIVMDNGDTKMSNAVSFLRRQAWSAVKLLSNIASFSGTLADGALAPLAITSLLQRYLLTAIKCSSPVFASELCERIVQCLPRSWIQRMEEAAVLKQLLASCHVVLNTLTDNPLHLKSLERIRDVINILQNNITK